MAPPDSPAEFWMNSEEETKIEEAREKIAPPSDPLIFALLDWKRHPGPIDTLPAARSVMAPPLPVTLLLMKLLRLMDDELVLLMNRVVGP